MLASDFLRTFPNGAGVQGVMQSPPNINLLLPSTGNVLTPNFPATPARFFLPVGIRYVITSINGTITTGPTDNMGNNVAKTNVVPSGIHLTAAAMNLSNTGGSPSLAAAFAPAVNQLMIDTATPFAWDISIGAVVNTATVARGRLFLAGFWFEV